MIDVNSGRLIGDFFEINADLIRLEVEPTNFFKKTYNRLYCKRIRKKLLKSSRTINKIILSTKHIVEFLIYINSSKYETNFGDIKKVIINDNYMEAMVITDNIEALITISDHTKNNIMMINILLKDEKGTNSYNFEIAKLYSDINTTKDIINKLNEIMCKNIVAFIDDSLKPFLKTKREVKKNE